MKRLLTILFLLFPLVAHAFVDPTLPTSDVDITTGFFELSGCTVGGCTSRTGITDNAGLDTAIDAAVCGDECPIY